MTEETHEKIEPEAQQSTVERLLELSKSLTAEERAELIKIGVVVPTAGDPLIQRWGLVCTQCGDLALTFLGEEQPNLALPVELLAWTQERHDPINRMQPTCQHCRRSIILTKERQFRDRNHPQSAYSLVVIEEWREKRREALERARRHLRKVSGYGPDSSVGAVEAGLLDSGRPQSKQSQIQEMHRAGFDRLHDADSPPSTLSEIGSVQELEAFAQRHADAGTLMPAMRGQRGRR